MWWKRGSIELIVFAGHFGVFSLLIESFKENKKGGSTMRLIFLSRSSVDLGFSWYRPDIRGPEQRESSLFSEWINEILKFALHSLYFKTIQRHSWCGKRFNINLSKLRKNQYKLLMITVLLKRVLNSSPVPLSIICTDDDLKRRSSSVSQ